MVRAIVLTHGHEDHIGALPYILRDLNVPIYGTRFTLALVRKRLEEAGLAGQGDLREVIPGRRAEIGPFDVEFIHVTHSTIDCVALAMRTPVGVIIHTGDFKMDQTPMDGQRLRPARLCALRPGRRAGAIQRQHQRGAAGVHAVGARGVEPHRGTVPRGAASKVLVSCFASLDPPHPAGHRHRRGGGPQGRIRRPQHGGQRGDRARAGAAAHSGRHGDAAAGHLRSFDPKKMVVLVSGSQAEPMSSLSRIAVDNHRLLSVDQDDTVILSARIIPGNEKAIFRMLDHMFRRRALVYYDKQRRPIARFRPRQPGRAETDAEPGAAEIFHSGSRRIPATVPARGAGAAGGRGLRARFCCSRTGIRSNSPRTARTGASRCRRGACASIRDRSKRSKRW